MWWRLVTNYPYKSFDNCHSQGVSIDMSSHMLTYESTMCNPKIYASEIVTISIFIKIIPLLGLLLNICKLSYFIGYTVDVPTLTYFFPHHTECEGYMCGTSRLQGTLYSKIGVSELGQSALYGIHMHVNLTGGRSDTCTNGGPPSVISSPISYPW